jgi:hypothetical protein
MASSSLFQSPPLFSLQPKTHTPLKSHFFAIKASAQSTPSASQPSPPQPIVSKPRRPADENIRDERAESVLAVAQTLQGPFFVARRRHAQPRQAMGGLRSRADVPRRRRSQLRRSLWSLLNFTYLTVYMLFTLPYHLKILNDVVPCIPLDALKSNLDQ